MSKYSLESRREYYDNYYERDLQLPDNVSVDEFFDEEFLQDLITSKANSIYLGDSDLRCILKGKNGALLLSIIMKVRSLTLSTKILAEEILSNDNLLSEFRRVLTGNMIYGKILNMMKDNLSLILKCMDIIKDNEYLSSFFLRNSPGFVQEVITDEVFVNRLLALDASTFFDVIKKLDINDNVKDVINRKINLLSDFEIIEVLNRVYDIDKDEPEYLRDLYNEYKEDLIKFKMRRIEEFSTDIGIEALMEGYLEPEFSSKLEKLGLDSSLRERRKEHLYNILVNYDKYSLESVRNVFCAFYFEKSANDVRLDLKTILEYANKNNDAKDIVGDRWGELSNIFYFLNNDKVLMNPCEIVKTSSIGEVLEDLVARMHEIFQKSVEQKVKIDKGMLKSKNGVYYLEDSNHYFLVHSTKAMEAQKLYEGYKENSLKHGKMCFSLLDDKRNKVFNKDAIIFGYDKLDGITMYSACTMDAQTNQRSALVRQYASHLVPLGEFMACTNPNSYNELAFLTNREITYPSYVLSINKEPTDLEIEVAQVFNIPVIVYYTKNLSEDNSYTAREKETYDYSKYLLVIKKHKDRNLEYVPQ